MVSEAANRWCQPLAMVERRLKRFQFAGIYA
jgi:hypothetical protein